MFASADEIKEKRRIMIHNAPLLISIVSIPVICGAISTGSYIKIPHLFQTGIFFVGTIILLELYSYVTDKIRIPLAEEYEDDAPSGLWIRISTAIPLFFFGTLIKDPAIALWWGAGFGAILSSIGWYFIKFLPKE